jgi:DNA-binding NarL/FixJ family response regulator
LIVDDNMTFAKAAGLLLEREGLAVVGVAANAAEAMRETRALRPDVVLLDIVLGGESGFDVARELIADGERTTIIFISTHSEADFAELIADAAAAGFIPKSELSAEAIRRLAA